MPAAGRISSEFRLEIYYTKLELMGYFSVKIAFCHNTLTLELQTTTTTDETLQQ